MIFIIFAILLFFGQIFRFFEKFVLPFCERFGMESTIYLWGHSATKCIQWISVLLFGLFIFLLLGYKFNPQEPSQWIRWEWKLLVSLKKDVEYISEEGTKINEKASKIWGSVRPEVTGLQIDAYRRWAETAKDVITKAERWYEAYERLNKRMVFPKLLFFALWDFKAKHDLGIEGHLIELELRRTRTEYGEAQRTCGSLERSMSNVRSLQERPIVDTVYKRDENWHKPIDENLGYLTDDWLCYTDDWGYHFSYCLITCNI